MAEYRHIANLRGPEGLQADEPKGTLSASSDLGSLDFGSWAVPTVQVHEALGLPGNRATIGTLRKQQITSSRYQYRFEALDRGDERTEIWVLGMDNSGVMLEDWKRIYPDQETSDGSAAGAIKSLAARDGWLGVYDPTDTSCATLLASGRMSGITDGLGTLPDMTAVANPWHLPNAFGAIAGFDGTSGTNTLRVDFSDQMAQQLTIVTLAQNISHGPAAGNSNRFLFDGGLNGGRNAFAIGFADPTYFAYDGVASMQGEVPDTDPHVFTCVFDGDNTYTSIDGQMNHYGGRAQFPQRVSGLTVGASWNGTRAWHGTIGPVLIYLGVPPQDVLNRMTGLLHALSGIPRRDPRPGPETRVLSVDSEGQETLRVGDPDAFGRSGIASMTKMMTCWLARQWLTDTQLDDTVTIDERDVNNNVYRDGDIISYRDLMYATALPSSNATPAILARNIGQKILNSEGETGEPRTRFVIEMEREAQRLGFEGVSFTVPWNDGRMTPRQVAQLLRLMLQDDALREIFGARRRTLTFEGPEPRIWNVTHTVENYAPFPVKEFIAAKTGTGAGRVHVAMAWEHPDGSEHITVITDVPDDDGAQRYVEFWRAMIAVTHGAALGARVPGGTSDLERTTQTRDISDELGVIDREDESSGVFLTRNGNQVTIWFNSVRLPEDMNAQGYLPVGLRPHEDTAATVTTHNGDTVRLKAFRFGALRLYGNSSDDVLDGSMSFPIMASRFVAAPFPGIPRRIEEGP